MRRPFTLVELIAVIVILMVTATFAVSTLRGESPARQVANAAHEFEAYCARVRYAAVEHGSDRIVSFDPSARRFVMVDPANRLETREGALSWQLPESFEVAAATLSLETDEQGVVEVFRFFADGSAAATRDFTLRFKKLQRRFEVSPLTGMLIQKEEPAE